MRYKQFIEEMRGSEEDFITKDTIKSLNTILLKKNFKFTVDKKGTFVAWKFLPYRDPNRKPYSADFQEPFITFFGITNKQGNSAIILGFELSDKEFPDRMLNLRTFEHEIVSNMRILKLTDYGKEKEFIESFENGVPLNQDAIGKYKKYCSYLIGLFKGTEYLRFSQRAI